MPGRSGQQQPVQRRRPVLPLRTRGQMVMLLGSAADMLGWHSELQAVIRRLAGCVTTAVVEHADRATRRETVAALGILVAG